MPKIEIFIAYERLGSVKRHSWRKCSAEIQEQANSGNLHIILALEAHLTSLQHPAHKSAKRSQARVIRREDPLRDFILHDWSLLHLFAKLCFNQLRLR